MLKQEHIGKAAKLKDGSIWHIEECLDETRTFLLRDTNSGKARTYYSTGEWLFGSGLKRVMEVI